MQIPNMSSSNHENHIMDILKASFPIAKDIKFKETSIVGQGQHYTSGITYLTMTYQEEHRYHRLDLAIKIPNEPEQSQFFEDLYMFRREALVYEKMLPLVNQILDIPPNPFHYHTEASRIHVLEDVGKQGYESRDMTRSLNLEQCYPTLRTLSHFHAATHKIHQTYPQLLSEDMFQRLSYIDLRKNIISTWEPILCNLLRKKGASNLIPKFLATVSFLKQDDDVIISLINQSNFNFVVLNHGDFRIPNILFKYSSAEIVESVKIIDFQTCAWSSPVADIIYFLTTSVHIDVIDEHFNTLVEWYLRCLNGKLKDLGSCEVYTMDHFMEDFNKLKPLLTLGAMCLSTIMCPLDRAQISSVFMLDENKKPNIDNNNFQDERLEYVAYGWLKFCEKMAAFDGYPSTYLDNPTCNAKQN